MENQRANILVIWSYLIERRANVAYHITQSISWPSEQKALSQLTNDSYSHSMEARAIPAIYYDHNPDTWSNFACYVLQNMVYSNCNLDLGPWWYPSYLPT